MSDTNIPTAIANRAAEMGGEVVRLDRGTDAYEGCAAGLVMWKRPNEHFDGGEEYVTHMFYVRKGEDVAVFEAGTYGDLADANTAWARRVRTI